MVILMWIVLLAMWNVLIVQSDMVSCYADFFCTNDFSSADSCTIFGGIMSNRTCEEMGYEMGKCCNLGYCYSSTKTMCALLSGKWNKETCPCDDVNSCCLGVDCTEDFSSDECTLRNGTFVEGRPCAAKECLAQGTTYGACCNDFDQTCFSVPNHFCDPLHEWNEGMTCEEVGCFPREEVPIFDNTSSYIGRCCTTRLCVPVSETEQCSNANSYFQEGLGCNHYPCTRLGACVKDDYCGHSIAREPCLITGASWIEGGTCAGLGDVGKCTFDDNCNSVNENTCNSYNGNWENGTTCTPTPGACCDLYNEKCVDETLNIYCNMQYGKFHPGKSCSEVECFGTCCIEDFCISWPESICLLVNNSYYEDQTCPDRGTCSEHLVFSERKTAIPKDITVRDIRISASSSEITFNAASMDTTTIDLVNGSVLYFGTLDFQRSKISFAGRSKLVVEGCVNFGEDSEIEVNMDQTDLTTLNAGENITLASYNCLSGSPLITKNDDCFESDIQQNIIILFGVCNNNVESEETSSTQTLMLFFPALFSFFF